MSDKQLKFVAEFLVDGNGARAARAAGYGASGSRVAAHRLLTNANVRAAIKARQGVDASRLEISRQDVISGLLEAFLLAKQRADAGVMVSAGRELGRMLGFYPPVEVRARQRQAPPAEGVDPRGLTNAELDALLAAAEGRS